MNRWFVSARTVIVATFCLVGPFASSTQAQRTAEELAEINRAAMEAYLNLEVEAARDLLLSGIQSATDNNVSGRALADAYVSLGVIYMGGFDERAKALEAFENALRQDSDVEVAAAVNTPDIAAVFDEARSRVFEAAPPAPTGGSVEGNLDHDPVARQQAQTGVPVYVEVDDDLDVAVVRIFYRSVGMKEPSSADMREMENGWGYVIPCEDVFEPTVEYFIVAIDDEGQQVGNAGSPRQPVVVPIVSQLDGPAPSLPGQPPPQQCGVAHECPPGMPGCRGSSGLGDTCRSDAECQAGLICDDNFCSLGERDDPRDRDGDGKAPRGFVRLGGGLGLSYVKSGMKAAENPSSEYFSDIDLNAEDALEQLQERAGDAYYECDFSNNEVSNCTAELSKNGLVASPALRLEAGYFVTERVSVAAMFRMQIGAASGTLAGYLLGARVGYLLTEPRETGFQPSWFGGLSVGQIQPQPRTDPPPDLVCPPEYTIAECNQDPSLTIRQESPHIASGLMGVHTGVHLGYRFVRNFGIYLQPEIDLLFPDVLFHIDLTGGVEVAF